MQYKREHIIVREMIYETAPMDWGKWIEGLNAETLQNVARHADSLAISAAEIAAYAEARGAAGSGDAGHDQAFEIAKKQGKKIRKALGYYG